MTDTLSAGRAAEAAERTRKTPCPGLNAKKKKHKWIQKGGYPSVWYECKHCKTPIYYS